VFYVSVLQSETAHHYYTGYATELVQRVGQHNAGITKSTKDRGPWKLVHQEQYETRAEAMRREKFLKSGQGRELLADLIAKRHP